MLCSAHPTFRHLPLTLIGRRGTDELIRAHARQAGENGTSVIEGMIEVKRALREAGEDVSPHAIKLHRKVFVDEFYFSQRADHWARLH